jgi:hypothetical protein
MALPEYSWCTCCRSFRPHELVPHPGPHPRAALSAAPAAQSKLKVVVNEKGGGGGWEGGKRLQYVSDRGDRGLFKVWTCTFEKNSYFLMATGDADRICNVKYETVLNLRIFFWFEPHLFSRTDESMRK